MAARVRLSRMFVTHVRVLFSASGGTRPTSSCPRVADRYSGEAAMNLLLGAVLLVTDSI